MTYNRFNDNNGPTSTMNEHPIHHHRGGAFNTNNAKTVLLLAGLAGALVLAGGALGGSGGAVIGLLLGLMMVGGSYWFSDKLAVKAAAARPLQPGELTWLHEDVARLAQRAG